MSVKLYMTAGLRTRRQTLGLVAMVPLIAKSAYAQEGREYPLNSDFGAALQNFRVPSELDPGALAGIVWRGRRPGNVVLYEFFDYNCGFCRKAAHDIDAIVGRNPDLRVGLINNPILSAGSVQAAKVQQAVLKLRGPELAYDFHLRMFSKHGSSDGQSALRAARDMGLDERKVEELADSPVVANVLKRQSQLASNLGMAITPSFVIAGIGVLGWPGANALQSIVSSVRKCDHPVCSGNR